MTVFFKRTIEAGLLAIWRHPNITITRAGVDDSPTAIVITQKGRDYVEELGLHEFIEDDSA